MTSALIFGSTGLVGSHLLEHLLQSPLYDSLRSLVRRPTGREHPKLSESTVNFDDIEAHRDIIKADDVFCAMGTTIRIAGSEAAFRKVDYDYVVNVAGLAVSNGAGRIFLVSSVGANADSVFFYPRVKGELERAIGKMPYRSVNIFRPSMILGERKEKRAIVDAIGSAMNATSFAMVGPFRKYRAIHADTIALAIVRAAALEVPGVKIYDGEAIALLAEE